MGNGVYSVEYLRNSCYTGKPVEERITMKADHHGGTNYTIEIKMSMAEDWHRIQNIIKQQIEKITV